MVGGRKRGLWLLNPFSLCLGLATPPLWLQAPRSPLCVAVTMCCEIPPPELENLVHPTLGAFGEPFLDIV